MTSVRTASYSAMTRVTNFLSKPRARDRRGTKHQPRKDPFNHSQATGWMEGKSLKPPGSVPQRSGGPCQEGPAVRDRTGTPPPVGSFGKSSPFLCGRESRAIEHIVRPAALRSRELFSDGW